MLLAGCVESYYLSCGLAFTALCVIPWGIHAVNGDVSSGDFATLVTLTVGMTEPLKRFGNFMRTSSNYAGLMSAVDEMLEKSNDLAESESPSGTTNITLGPLNGELNVKDVTFSYSGTTSSVLNGINCCIRKGTYVVVCGRSG